MAKDGNGGGKGVIRGNPRDNVLDGTDLNDIIQGLAGNDILNGFDGADLLDGGEGNDTADGGDGTDTAILSGARDLYVVTQLNDTTIQIVGPDGVDTYTNVEFFQFTDMTQSAAEIVVPRVADLLLDAATYLPSSDVDLNGDGHVDMSFSVTNLGNVDAGSFQIVTVLSTDGMVSDDDIVLGSSTYGLAPGATGDFTASYVVPENTPSSSYTIISYIEWAPLTGEADSTNNTVSAPITFVGGTIYGTDGADTVFSSQYIETFVLGAGDDTVIVRHDGDVFFGGDGQDLAILSGVREGFTVTQIDADSFVVTSADGTNTFHGIETFQFNEVTQSAADVAAPLTQDVAGGTPVLVDNAVVAGDAVTVTWAATQEDIAASGTFTTDLLLATAPDMAAVIDTVAIAEVTLTQIGNTFSQTSVVDTTGLAPGTYYVATNADSTDAITESDEGNNLSGWTEFTVEEPVYNLELSNVTVNAASDFDLNDGATVEMTITVTNTGNQDFELFSVQLFASEDNIGTYTLPDDWLGAAVFDGLAAGESVTVTITRRLDPMLVDGDYNLVAYIQSNFTTDGDTTDNSIMLSNAIPVTRTQLLGTADADIIAGTAADETYTLGDGDDVAIASTGADIILGGAGFDTADFSDWSSVEIYYYDYNGFLYTESVQSLNYYDTEFTALYDFERIIGTAGDDLISLSFGSPMTVEAGDGNDLVWGSAGDDTLDGGDGDDHIFGEGGNDTLTGGLGADVFLFNRDTDPYTSPFGPGGADIVNDFDVLQDTLVVQYQGEPGSYDPLLDAIQTADGVMINYADGGSVLLADILLDDLNSTNVYGYSDQVMAVA